MIRAANSIKGLQSCAASEHNTVSIRRTILKKPSSLTGFSKLFKISGIRNMVRAGICRRVLQMNKMPLPLKISIRRTSKSLQSSRREVKALLSLLAIDLLSGTSFFSPSTRAWCSQKTTQSLSLQRLEKKLPKLQSLVSMSKEWKLKWLTTWLQDHPIQFDQRIR